MDQAQKELLCQQLSALPAQRAKEVYGLIREHFKSNTVSFPRRLGNKTTVPFGGRQIGDDYEFQIDNLPSALLLDIKRYLSSE